MRSLNKTLNVIHIDNVILNDISLHRNYHICKNYVVNVYKKLTMEQTDLVTGNKELLIQEFRRLYPLHGTKWRSRLVKHNAWHNTIPGLRAWQNTTKKKPNVGNEPLRLIIADMQTIAASSRTKSTIKRQGLTRRIKA
jgi:hypothetical protein